MMRIRPRAPQVALAFAALLTAGPAGQQATPPPAGTGQPAFRAGAELVIVDAVVVDRAGRPVTDLTTADFEVRDEGKPRAVSLFQTVSTAGTAAALAGTTRRYPYSSNAGIDARPTRAFVLFFDDVHLTQAEGDRAKVALTRFMETELEDGDLVSLVAPGSALRWHARIPNGRRELAQIIAGLKGLYAPDASSEQISDYEAYRITAFQDEVVANQVDRRWRALRVAGREPANLATDKGFQPQNRGGMIGLVPQDIAIRSAAVYQQAAARNLATLQALERTIDGLGAVRGRKAVLLLSPGFIDDQERAAAARRTIDAARRANVAVYFVDARGLMVGTPALQAQAAGPLDSRDIVAANADLTLSAEGAETLSQGTGGFSVRNQNDLGGALQRIGNESRVYYLLGFQPDAGAKPGTFRRLEVKVTRPGVTVRARRGYYAGGVPATREAPPTASAATTGAGTKSKWDADGVDTLERAAESPYELASIPLRARSYVFGDATADAALVMLVVEADLRAFTFDRKDGKLADVLDLRMLTTELGTNATERYERQVEMTFPPAARFGPESWHALGQEFRLRPGRYQARIAVRDGNSGKIGAVTHDFEVARPAGLRLTTPILTDTIEAPSFGASAPPKPVLIVRRQFPAGTTLYYQYAVLGASKDAAGATKVVGAHALHGPDGRVVKQLEPRPLTPAPDGALSRLAGLSLTGLPAGDYELVLRVTDQIRGETIETREPLAILPPEATPASAAGRVP